RITMLSPQLEADLEQFFNVQEAEISFSSVRDSVIQGCRKVHKPLWFDSEEERIFHDEILPKLLGENYDRFVLPQVHLSSLIPFEPDTDLSLYGRVDFALFVPWLEERFVIEIDGEHHKSHGMSDWQRDKVLQEHGYTVVRVGAQEIRNRSGGQLSFLSSKLSKAKEIVSQNAKAHNVLKFINAVKIAHQIQIVLLQALQSGFLDFDEKTSWQIVTDLNEIGLFDNEEAFVVLQRAVEDFEELLHRLSNLYSVDFKMQKSLCTLLSEFSRRQSEHALYISFSHKTVSELPTFFVQNIYVPFHIANSSSSVSPAIGGLKEPKEEDLQYFLRYLFRKPYFWEGQYEGISRALQGKDVLLLLPTGGGKSLVYQLASMLLPGRTVVIDPIISLMEDQIDNLARIGIDRCVAITSQIVDPKDKSRVIQLFGQGEYLFAYVAPERFQTVEFRESLRTLTVHTPIALIVIDETHCVSEWGHDFRTAYLNIGRVSRQYCESHGYVPPLIALTGTASRAVLKDVQRELQIEDFDAIITPKSFDRKELKFHILYSKSQEKMATLKGYFKQLPSLFNSSFSSFYQTRGDETYSGLVFCPHVGGDFGITKVKEEIDKDLRIPNDIYSGKEPKFWSTDQYRSHKQRATRFFKRNKIPLLVCTKAFGMGIDKPNIRYTIHFGLPTSIESFYQEAGRAGRDRKIAHCCIIVSVDDLERAKRLLNPNTRVEEIDRVIREMNKEDNDDITRVFYFHINAFRGIDKEKEDVRTVLSKLSDVSKRSVKTILANECFYENRDDQRSPREITEKALHRLLVIGVVSDYTINYAHDEFTVTVSGATKEEIIEAYGRYVASYLYSRRQVEVEKASRLLSFPHNQFVLGIVDLLLRFIYDVIERGRRRAFYEMVLACSNSPTDEQFRQRILRYLESTEYSETLEEVINDQKAGLEKCKDLFGMVCSFNEAAELRGQVSRYLESYPDHPSLLMLRSLSEVFSKDRNWEVVKQNFTASISSALENYGLSEKVVYEFASWALSVLAIRDRDYARELVVELLQKRPERLLARKLVEILPTELAEIPAWFLLTRLQQDCETLILKGESTTRQLKSRVCESSG
ncbi:MAG: RecQ family ATP-dependent DNA helicase, partial [Pseudothermotoga sp.]